MIYPNLTLKVYLDKDKVIPRNNLIHPKVLLENKWVKIFKIENGRAYYKVSNGDERHIPVGYLKIQNSRYESNSN